MKPETHLLGTDEAEQHQAEKEAVVLEVNGVKDEESRMEEYSK